MKKKLIVKLLLWIIKSSW